MLRIRRLRENNISLLDVPAQDDLDIALAVFPAQLREDGLIDQILVAMADGIPAFNGCTIGGDAFFQRRLLVIRMALHRQHRRFDDRRIQHFFQPVGFKVGQADGPDLAFCHGLFHILPCTQIITELLMKKQKIDVIRTQAGQHLINARHGLPFPVLTGPQLGCDPDFFAGNAALPDSSADAALILIGMRRINVPVTQFQCIEAGLLCCSISLHHVDAKTELRNFCTVVECHISLFHIVFLLRS